MEHGLKFQEFIGYGRRKDISNLKVYNSKNEQEEKNLRNHQKDYLMRLTMSNKLRKKNEKTIESMNQDLEEQKLYGHQQKEMET